MQKKSYDSVKIKSLSKKKVLKELKHIAKMVIKENPNVMELSLFGSLANEDYTGISDADILIILRKDSTRFIDRIPPFLARFLDVSIPIDIFPYTEDEISKMGKDNYFIKNIQNEKIVLAKR